MTPIANGYAVSYIPLSNELIPGGNVEALDPGGWLRKIERFGEAFQHLPCLGLHDAEAPLKAVPCDPVGIRRCLHA